MTKVQEIQAAIESLPREEYVRLRQWFSERDWEQWDKQIEADSEAGKLDFLINEATSKGAKVELLVHPGGHSFDVVDDSEDSRAIIKKTLEFFQVHLGTH